MYTNCEERPPLVAQFRRPPICCSRSFRSPATRTPRHPTRTTPPHGATARRGACGPTHDRIDGKEGARSDVRRVDFRIDPNFDQEKAREWELDLVQIMVGLEDDAAAAERLGEEHDVGHRLLGDLEVE